MHSAEKIHWGILECFIDVGYIKNIRDERGGGNHNFPSKMVFLTVPKHFEGESISVSLVSFIEICYRQERMGVNHDFHSKFFCLAGLKNFVGENFCAVNPKNFGCGKIIYKSRGRVSRLPGGNYFLHSADKIHRGILQCFIDVGFKKKLGITEGAGITIFRRKCFSHSAESF